MTISPSEFLRRKSMKPNNEVRSYTYAEVLQLLADYAKQCVSATPSKTTADLASDIGMSVQPTAIFGSRGARWECLCGKTIGSSGSNVDVHCSCGRVWRKLGRSEIKLHAIRT